MRYHRFLSTCLSIYRTVSDGTGPLPQRCCRKPLRGQRPSQTGERRQDAGGKAARREDRVEVPPSLPVLPPHITFHPLRPHTRTRAYPRARAHIRAPVHTEGDTRSRARSHTHTHPRPHRNPHTHTHTHTQAHKVEDCWGGLTKAGRACRQPDKGHEWSNSGQIVVK